MKRALLVALSFLPGSVAILEGRVWIGAALMVSGLFGWDFAVLGLTGLLHGPYAPILGTAALGIAVAATCVSVWQTVRGTSPARQERSRQAAEHALREGLKSYLRGDAEKAQIAADSGLAVAPNDVDLVFFRWQLALEDTSGSDALADRWVKRLKRIDDEEKWRCEVKARDGAQRDGDAEVGGQKGNEGSEGGSTRDSV